MRILFGEQFGPPERLGAVGEDGGPAILVFDGPLPARRVLVSEDVIAASVFPLSSPDSPGDTPSSLGSGRGERIHTVRGSILYGVG